MKLLHLGVLLVCGAACSVFSMEPEAQTDQEQQSQPLHPVIKEYFEKRQAAIGRFTAELGQSWRTENAHTWFQAQLQKKREEYYQQKKGMVLRIFVSGSGAIVLGWLSLSDQIARPEYKGFVAGAALASAAYSVSNGYDYYILQHPTEQMLLQEINQCNKTFSDYDWRNTLLADIGCKYLTSQSKR